VLSKIMGVGVMCESINITLAKIGHGGDINGEQAGDNSGVSVSLSADAKMVAIGSDRNDDNGFDAGHIRVFALK
jgi:hypothetical protein